MTMRWLWVAFLVAAGAAVPSGYAAAADGEGACPRAGTLGVSRTVEIDTTGGPVSEWNITRPTTFCSRKKWC